MQRLRLQVSGIIELLPFKPDMSCSDSVIRVHHDHRPGGCGRLAPRQAIITGFPPPDFNPMVYGHRRGVIPGDHQLRPGRSCAPFDRACFELM